MKTRILSFIFGLIPFWGHSQTNLIMVGTVLDAGTKEPLAYANVSVKNHPAATITTGDGRFRLLVPSEMHRDTLVVTHLGYGRFEKPLALLASDERILLEEAATLLDEVTVVHRKLDLREVDANLCIVRGNLYAMSTEVTNAEYHDFLVWLEDHNQTELRKKYDFHLAGYNGSAREFYTTYHRRVGALKRPRKDEANGFAFYPVVNIDYDAAVAYCAWLTERYNENTKRKKFAKVVFRLPTLSEWQIAALGYPKFQSWNLLENKVDVIVTADSLSLDMLKGEKKTVQVDSTFLYPWYFPWHYRNKPQNSRHCFLGNFRIDSAIPCPTNAPAYDGFSMMARVASYFPNNIGLYDVVGNVAELISEKGKACGGSWRELPAESTIQSVKSVNGPDETVGFRVFMEVLEN